TVRTHRRAEAAAEAARKNQPSPVEVERLLDALQRNAFVYFVYETNPANGLVADKTPASEPPWTGEAPASIAAVGFALGAYPVGVERGLITRAEAVERTLAALRFFWTRPQGT